MKYRFPITSERLDFQPLTLNDCEGWAPFFQNNPGLKYLAIENPKAPMEEAKTWIERQLKRYDETGWGHLKVSHKQSGEFIGNAGLILRPQEGADLLEVGYSILPEQWGKGYASEAAICLKEYIHSEKLSDRAISMIHSENIGSQKVAEKNGMTRGKRSEYMGMPIDIYEVIF